MHDSSDGVTDSRGLIGIGSFRAEPTKAPEDGESSHTRGSSSFSCSGRVGSGSLGPGELPPSTLQPTPKSPDLISLSGPFVMSYDLAWRNLTASPTSQRALWL